MFVGAATFFVVMGILVSSSESAFLTLSRSGIALFLTFYAVISLGGQNQASYSDACDKAEKEVGLSYLPGFHPPFFPFGS